MQFLDGGIPPEPIFQLPSDKQLSCEENAMKNRCDMPGSDSGNNYK